MRRPQVAAHRGASGEVAEHTLTAYEQALVDGADALECDVRLTADGHLVCVHDRRIDRTSNGRGPVSTKTLADLGDHDFGGWKESPGWEPDRVGPGQGVLTLARLVELVEGCGRPVELAIETKHPTRYAGLVEHRLVELLQAYGLGSGGFGDVSVRVMSFSALSLRRMRVLAPRVPTVFLMERVPLRMRDGSLPFAAGAAGPSIDIVRAHPSYVRKVHRAGHRVHVWTVDEPADVMLCHDLGVDTIITNRPRETLALLGEHAPGP